MTIKGKGKGKVIKIYTFKWKNKRVLRMFIHIKFVKFFFKYAHFICLFRLVIFSLLKMISANIETLS